MKKFVNIEAKCNALKTSIKLQYYFLKMKAE